MLFPQTYSLTTILIDLRVAPRFDCKILSVGATNQYGPLKLSAHISGRGERIDGLTIFNPGACYAGCRRGSVGNRC